ncbi:hypothetical protein HanIR_Chr14g0672691 [Helianthus annuus]|nr:hypothetical protein HanIR_Chr14g0672691 [Helianthus annuus]
MRRGPLPVPRMAPMKKHEPEWVGTSTVMDTDMATPRLFRPNPRPANKKREEWAM